MVARGTGELLVTAGVVLLLYVVYVFFGTGLQAAQEQRELRDDLTRTWASPAPVSAAPQTAATPNASAPPPPAPLPGAALALLRLPRFGRLREGGRRGD